jgi:hypothetical protein
LKSPSRATPQKNDPSANDPSSFLHGRLINYPEFKHGEIKALFEMLQRTQRPMGVVCFAGPSIEADPEKLRKPFEMRRSSLSGTHPKNAIMQLW